MLKAARNRLLCRSCRSKLLTLFENGLCARNRQRPRHALLAHPCKRSNRQFSRLLPERATQRPDESLPSVETPSPEIRDLESSKVHDAVVDLLEKELGMPLEEAMEKDRAAVQALVSNLSLTDTSQVILEGAENPLEQMRERGASETDVVREARNIFGDTLPSGALNGEEFVKYRRLYGDPVPDVDNEALGFPSGEFMDKTSTNPPNTLYSVDGEKIDYNLERNPVSHDFEDSLERPRRNETRRNTDAKSDTHKSAALTTAKEIASSLRGQVVREESDDELDADQDEHSSRAHPSTILGKFATSPKTIFLPGNEFVRPVERMMSDFSNKHLKEMCERTFGGPGLPDSPLTPRFWKFRQQSPIPLEASQSVMGEMEANAFVTSIMPPTYASILSVLAETRKRLGRSWLTRLLAKDGGPRVLDVSSGGAGIIAWREMVKAHWETIHSSDRNPPPVPTSKSVVLVGSDTLRHRAADMLENTTFVPRLPDYVHTRDAPTLEDDRQAQKRKQFDVIIAPHSLFTLKEEWMRKQHVQNLWSLLNSEGGVLILIEKGMPRGFEAVAGAREMLLERYIASPPGHETQYSKLLDNDSLHKKDTAMIIAPCTNHQKCPMYTVPGLSKGRKDVCSFQQRYIRPPFLQRILGASDRNHDDVDFSYLSVLKGDDLRTRDFQDWSHVEDPSSAPAHSYTPNNTSSDSSILDSASTSSSKSGAPSSSQGLETISPLPVTHQLPRTILPPIKRKGHVSLDVCTPSGTIERWTVPRSFSKQAYRDARKSGWGDLWALGAKSKTARNLSLGISEKDLASRKKNSGEASVGKGRGRKERLKIKAEQLLNEREQNRLAEIQEQDEFMSELDEELDGVRTSNSISNRAPPYTHNPKIYNATDNALSNKRDDEDNVSQILSEWQEEYNQLGPDTKRQSRRLNKLDKKKLKKNLRTMHQGRSS